MIRPGTDQSGSATQTLAENGRLQARAGATLDAVVAIAAKNEADLIAACLDAAMANPGARAVLLVNNSSDGTARTAREHTGTLSGRVTVIEEVLPRAEAHAGGARRRVGTVARGMVGPGGLILFTDADSQPAPDWLAQMTAGLAGADMVCGAVDLPPDAFARRGAEADARMAVEGEYLALTHRFLQLVDPDPSNPLPNHGCRSGCNLGMTARAWDAIDGIPAIPVGEDRATVALAEAAGLRVRLLDGPRVLTSARRQGRAPGGMASALAMQDADPDPMLDEQCLPPKVLNRRARTRARLRSDGPGPWLTAAGIGEADIAALAGQPIGRVWHQLAALPWFAAPRLTTSTARAALPCLRQLVAAAEARRQPS